MSLLSKLRSANSKRNAQLEEAKLEAEHYKALFKEYRERLHTETALYRACAEELERSKATITAFEHLAENRKAEAESYRIMAHNYQAKYETLERKETVLWLTAFRAARSR